VIEECPRQAEVCGAAGQPLRILCLCCWELLAPQHVPYLPLWRPRLVVMDQLLTIYDCS